MPDTDLLHIGAQFPADLAKYNMHISLQFETEQEMGIPAELEGNIGSPIVKLTPLVSHVLKTANNML